MENGKFQRDNPITEKSYRFAVRIVRLAQFLQQSKREFTLSRQVLKSGTSIGANIAEAQQAQSKADFISKMSVSMKETTETKYWLRLLHDTGYLNDQGFSSIIADCIEIEKLLTAILKSSKQ